MGQRYGLPLLEHSDLHPELKFGSHFIYFLFVESASLELLDPQLHKLSSDEIIAQYLRLLITFSMTFVLYKMPVQRDKGLLLQIFHIRLLGETGVEPFFLAAQAEVLEDYHDLAHEANFVMEGVG